MQDSSTGDNTVDPAEIVQELVETVSVVESTMQDAIAAVNAQAAPAPGSDTASPEPVNTADPKDWLLRYVDRDRCAVLVPGRGPAGRSRELCSRRALGRHDGACCAEHALRASTRMQEGLYLVSVTQGWRTVQAVSKHEHHNHYTCNPCTVRCHCCGRGVLIGSARYHVSKCEAKAARLKRQENIDMDMLDAHHYQYPQGAHLMDALGAGDRALAHIATSGSIGRRRHKLYKHVYRKAKKKLTEDGYCETWRELWKHDAPSTSTAMEHQRPVAFLNCQTGRTQPAPPPELLPAGDTRDVDRNNNGNDNDDVSDSDKGWLEAGAALIGESSALSSTAGGPQGGTGAGVTLGAPLPTYRQRPPLDIFHDHAQHYACNPCAMRCAHCGMSVVLHGYHQHIERCAKVHRQRYRVSDDPKRSMRSVGRAQYPLAARAIELRVSTTTRALEHVTPAMRVRHAAEHAAARQGRRELEVFRNMQHTWFRARHGCDVRGLAASRNRPRGGEIPSEFAGAGTGMYWAVFRALGYVREPVPTRLPQAKGPSMYADVFRALGMIRTAPDEDEGNEEAAGAEENGAAARARAGRGWHVPLNVSHALQKSRRVPINGGALKGQVLGMVPTRGFSTCPVPLHDHSQHATCNPCTVKCPVCGWETTLAGYEFHVRTCRRLHQQRRAVEQGGLREALRRQYPGGSYLLDREERSPPRGLATVTRAACPYRALYPAIDDFTRKRMGLLKKKKKKKKNGSDAAGARALSLIEQHRLNTGVCIACGRRDCPNRGKDPTARGRRRRAWAGSLLSLVEGELKRARQETRDAWWLKRDSPFVRKLKAKLVAAGYAESDMELGTPRMRAGQYAAPQYPAVDSGAAALRQRDPEGHAIDIVRGMVESVGVVGDAVEVLEVVHSLVEAVAIVEDAAVAVTEVSGMTEAVSLADEMVNAVSVVQGAVESVAVVGDMVDVLEIVERMVETVATNGGEGEQMAAVTQVAREAVETLDTVAGAAQAGAVETVSGMVEVVDAVHNAVEVVDIVETMVATVVEEAGRESGGTSPAPAATPQTERWQARVVERGMCGAYVTGGRRNACLKFGSAKFGGACCPEHQRARELGDVVPAGTHLVGSKLGWAELGDVADHGTHVTCNPCTVQCSYCERPILVGGMPFHAPKCAQRARLAAEVHAADRPFRVALRHQYPAGTKHLQREARRTAHDPVRQAVARRRRRTQRVLQREKKRGAGLHDHANHHTCSERDGPGMPCTMLCLYCSRPVLVSGFAQHSKACAAHHTMMEFGDGNHEARRQSAREEFRHRDGFALFASIRDAPAPRSKKLRRKSGARDGLMVGETLGLGSSNGNNRDGKSGHRSERSHGIENSLHRLLAQI